MNDERMEMEEMENYYCPGCSSVTSRYEEEEIDGEIVMMHEECGEALTLRYSCPYCKNEYHETPEDAVNCCTKITPIDWPSIIKDYPA